MANSTTRRLRPSTWQRSRTQARLRPCIVSWPDGHRALMDLGAAAVLLMQAAQLDQDRFHLVRVVAVQKPGEAGHEGLAQLAAPRRNVSRISGGVFYRAGSGKRSYGAPAGFCLCLAKPEGVEAVLCGAVPDVAAPAGQVTVAAVEGTA